MTENRTAPSQTSSTKSVAYLVVSEGSSWSQSFRLDDENENVIGRRKGNAIVLQDAFCSRNHCHVYFEGNCWLIRDLGSKNGTLLGNELIESDRILQPGDIIKIGSYRLAFTYDPEEMSRFETKQPSAEDTSHDLKVVEEPNDSQSSTLLQKRPDRRSDVVEKLIGRSRPMEELRTAIQRVAKSTSTVLIRGESGVGKELVAAAIHAQSPRASHSFVGLNCASISESLLESELFGHEKGAFTGAHSRKVGKFELANHGTLFLDEVGEMSPQVQASLLRVLDGHPFERVGGGTPIQSDVRIIAATNRNLEEAVRSGRFRQDLYFRLHVAEIVVPPLRDRREDISLLANAFLQKFRRTDEPRELSAGAIERLMAYDWPGNVRELENTIERVLLFGNEEVIDESDLRLSGARLVENEAEGPVRFGRMSLETVELSHILSVLESVGWNKTKASQILGIERSTLDRKLKKHDIRRPGT